MRTYKVMEGDKVQAHLHYWEDTDEYQLVLTDDSTLVPYWDGELGKIIPKDESKEWVRDRVFRPGRANIMQILEGIGHTDYKEIYFIDSPLMLGRCVRDPYYIVSTEVAMELTNLELAIMEYAKQTDFHGTLKQFLEQNSEIGAAEAMEALRSLKRQRIASTSPDLMNSWIGATNFGHKKLGWR